MLPLALILALATAETPTDSASAAIARGATAEAAGDGRGMLAAARTLEALGAAPRSGEADLAAYWRAQALARGVKDKLPPVRGRALGPAYSRGSLSPGATLSTEQVFLAGQKAEVALVPQPGRNLAITVVLKERSICARASAGPRIKCDWIPTFTDRVQIRITNSGRVSALYYLVSN
ncbi:MAG: hypothetical protein V4808_13040 [Pseudomonadota bacterium]